MSSEDITINGNEYDPDTVSTGIQILSANARGITPESGSGLGGADISSDGSISRWNGYQYGGERDIYQVLGYDSLDDNTALEKYRSRYNRQDIAERVVDIFPEETWKHPPEVSDDGEGETEFERAANRLIKSDLNTYLRRTDRAQRLGEYGVMMVGFDDGQDLDQPVQESAINSPDDISFYNVFPQEQVEAWELGKDLEDGEPESDPSHERYNKPVYYRLDFGDIDADSTDDDFDRVHWSRVVPHAAEGALETDLKGQPALKPIYNRLIDREKVIGASAEMFYTGADRKIIANVSDDFALKQYSDTGEREDFKSQLSRVVNDLQQTMVSTGMDFEVLGGQEVDPSGVVSQIDSSIAANTGIPKNKLQGNETGERSTTMDRNNWFDTINSRQTNFAGPQMLRPVIARFVEFGVLPTPVGNDFAIAWPDLDTPSESDVADTQNQRASMLQASGLGMTLSSEQKLTFIQDGPDAVDMDDDGLTETPVNEANPDVQDAFMKATATNQDVSLTPPQDVQDHAQEVLDWREDDEKNVEGMTDTGWSRARQLASGEALSPGDVQEIYAWFARHGPDEYELNEDGMDPWRDAGRVAIKGWGGPPMRDWIAGKREALTEAGELEPVSNALAHDFSLNQRYSEGDAVETPDGRGIVSEIRTEAFSGKGDDEVDASEDSPTYVVALEDGRIGVGFYKASDLDAIDVDELGGEDVPDNPEDDLAENTAGQWDRLLGLLTGNQDGFFEWPESWEESDTPARVIALRAWANMGGRHGGGSQGGCTSTMRGKVADPDRFCADYKDRILGWEGWRRGG